MSSSRAEHSEASREASADPIEVRRSARSSDRVRGIGLRARLDPAYLTVLAVVLSGLSLATLVVASVIDRSEPSGRHWHRELLRQMTVALPKIRPAVLSPKTERSLQEYLSFRHVVRNVYAFRLDPGRIEKLAGDAGVVLKGVDEELEGFAAVPETLSEGD